MTVPDLLRLLVVPVFAWVAWHDVQTRRIRGDIWYPLVALGVALVAWDWVSLPPDPLSQRLFLVRVFLSVVLLGGLGFGFWYLGALGGADAKAFLTIGVLYPVFPTYELAGQVLPLVRPRLGVFSLTILTDGVLLAIAFPVLLYAWNVANGHTSPRGLFYHAVPVEALPASVGSMYVGTVPSGSLPSRIRYYASMLNPQKDRLDLDALRMYLRWRGLALADLLAHPEELRRPATLPAEPNPPTDGVVDPELDPEPAGRIPAATFGGPKEDPWGAEAFLDDVGSAYGTTPEKLRDGLDLVVERESVWVSPGLPFLVPVFAGLVVALVFGDLLYALLGALGVI